jgi:sulfur carrier protein
MKNMKLIVNGKESNLEDGLTVSGLLIAQEVKMPEMVSVELNGKILKRSEFENTALNEGDKVEFLYFMGGGNVTI